MVLSLGAYASSNRAQEFIAVAHAGDPFITAYPWSSIDAGFGTKFSDPPFFELPTGIGQFVKWSWNRKDIALAHETSPFTTAYPWSNSGFGTKYSNPVTTPTGAARGVSFSRSSTEIVVGHNNSPFITAYPWTTGSGFGTKYSNPATLPTTIGFDADFHISDQAVLVIIAASQALNIYNWTNGSGFGSKFANPASAPGGGEGAIFNRKGTVVAAATDTSPFIHAYPFTVASGFGTKYSNPATTPGSLGRGVDFNKTNTVIAYIGTSSSPENVAYAWTDSSGFGTKYADSSTLSGIGNGICFSAYDNYIGLALDNSSTPQSRLKVYDWDNASGWGTLVSDPATRPTNTCNGVDFI